MPIHDRLKISFDLYIIGSWDGNFTGSGDPEFVGPDIWELSVDNNTLISTSFAQLGGDQSYPDQYPRGSFTGQTGALGADILFSPEFYTEYGDSVYHLEVTLDHASSDASIVFSGQMKDFTNTESWGLDNVSVQASKVTYDEFQANTYTSTNQECPSIAMNNLGDFVVVWESDNGQDGDGVGIYGQRYLANGTPIGPEFLVNTTTSGDQINTEVAMNDTGDFVVVWESSGDIYAQRYHADGTQNGSEFPVNIDNTSGMQEHPSVAADNTGRFVITWQSYGTNYDVYGQRYSESGSRNGGEFRVNTGTLGSQNAPSIAIDESGNFIIVWMSSVSDDIDIYAQRYYADGTANGNEFLVNSEVSNKQRHPTVGMDDSGNFVVAWHSEEQDGSGNGIYAQRYLSDGSSIGVEFRANSQSALDQILSAVAMNGRGEFVIAWQDNFNDGNLAGIFAQQYRADGTAIGDNIQVNVETTANQEVPSVAMDGSGKVTCVWQSEVQNEPVNYEIIGRMFSPSLAHSVDISCNEDVTDLNFGNYLDNAFLTDGLWAYYPFSGDAEDESGQGRNGSVTGAIPATDRFGDPDSAYYFNGYADWIELQNTGNPALDLTEFTVSAWVTNELPDDYDGFILSNYYDGLGSGFWLESSYEGFDLGLTGGDGTSALVPSSWYQVTATQDNGVVNLYVDGILQGSGSADQSPAQNTLDILVGRALLGHSPEHYWHGNIDDIRIYDRVLTSDEVHRLHLYESIGLDQSSFGPEHLISKQADGVIYVYSADINNDGYMDVLSASQLDNTIAWYENDGTPGGLGDWTAHIISHEVVYAVSVNAADINGDGYMDVLSASYVDNTITWYENDGTPGGLGDWTAHVISNSAGGAHSVYSVDVDNDGDIDVLSASHLDNTIAWYENDGTPGGLVVWTTHIISESAVGVFTLYSADLNGDGNMDVLSASHVDGTSAEIAWYENDGTPGGLDDWTEHIISNQADNDFDVYAIDIDGDSDIDVLSASYYGDTIAWYENDGTPGGLGDWTAHVISNSAAGAHSVYAADVDRDGDMDVLSASHWDNTIAWYENDGTPGGLGDWTEHIISNQADRALSVYVTDVDNDGDIDVLSASYNNDSITWYENQPWCCRKLNRS